MKLTPNALQVLEKRYLLRDETGRLLEDAEGLFRRVAKAIAASKPQEDAFFQLMTELDFLPNSPTLMNAGRPDGQLSACFVLPVGDSMDSIFDAVKQAALIHKSGGGTGFSFSRLRPAGSIVRTTGGVASGPVSFMRVFNAATEAVKQGGTRRGANMGVLRVDHPDILAFIRCKEDTREFTNFNISVAITDAFMQALENGGDYALTDPRGNPDTTRLSAQEVFDAIVDAAWKTGEPGVLFLDRINAAHPLPGVIEATNPCGEQPLLPYESCNLGSINLLNMAGPDGVDWDRLSRTVRLAVQFLDNVIQCNVYPLPQIAEQTLSARKIGLGVMGWADLLLKLRIPYDSEEALTLASRVMSLIRAEGFRESEALAEEKGVFPAYTEGRKRRNATVTTIAPTGTLSILAGVSSGIEPVFAFTYTRNIMDGAQLTEVNPVLQEALETYGVSRREDLPAAVRRVFTCAADITPEWHIRMQAAFQKHTDNAVSKTVNLPREATREQAGQVFRLAYALGCKGVTLYRDGSRQGQVLVSAGAEPGCDDCRVPQNLPLIRPRARARVTRGFTEKVKIGCGHLYVTVNFDDKGICEVFTNTGKKGGCASQSEATARLASAALRSGVDPAHIVQQLRGIRCPSTIRQQGEATSCPDGISRVIARALNLHDGGENEEPGGGTLSDTGAAANTGSAGSTGVAANTGAAGSTGAAGNMGAARLCPDCGEALAHESGCVVCHVCGYSRCG